MRRHNYDVSHKPPLRLENRRSRISHMRKHLILHAAQMLARNLFEFPARNLLLTLIDVDIDRSTRIRHDHGDHMHEENRTTTRRPGDPMGTTH
jgi:hypothetical protein